MHNKTLIGAVCLGGHREVAVPPPVDDAKFPFWTSGLGPGFNLMNSVAVGGADGVRVPRA
jgi:hypothetical protein